MRERTSQSSSLNNSSLRLTGRAGGGFGRFEGGGDEGCESDGPDAEGFGETSSGGGDGSDGSDDSGDDWLRHCHEGNCGHLLDSAYREVRKGNG